MQEEEETFGEENVLSFCFQVCYVLKSFCADFDAQVENSDSESVWNHPGKDSREKNKAKDRNLRNSGGRNGFEWMRPGAWNPFQRLVLHFFCELLRKLGKELDPESNNYLDAKLSLRGDEERI